MAFLKSQEYMNGLILFYMWVREMIVLVFLHVFGAHMDCSTLGAAV